MKATCVTIGAVIKPRMGSDQRNTCFNIKDDNKTTDFTLESIIWKYTIRNVKGTRPSLFFKPIITCSGLWIKVQIVRHLGELWNRNMYRLTGTPYLKPRGYYSLMTMGISRGLLLFLLSVSLLSLFFTIPHPVHKKKLLKVITNVRNLAIHSLNMKEI